MAEHSKNYNGDQIMHRMTVFANNMHKVIDLNMKNGNDGVTYALNQFSDLTTEEFKAIYLGYKKHVGIHPINNAETVTFENPIKAAVDWTTSGDVQKVKD
jgi:hypothetical protein